MILTLPCHKPSHFLRPLSLEREVLYGRPPQLYIASQWKLVTIKIIIIVVICFLLKSLNRRVVGEMAGTSVGERMGRSAVVERGRVLPFGSCSNWSVPSWRVIIRMCPSESLSPFVSTWQSRRSRWESGGPDSNWYSRITQYEQLWQRLEFH